MNKLIIEHKQNVEVISYKQFIQVIIKINDVSIDVITKTDFHALGFHTCALVVCFEVAAAM